MKELTNHMNVYNLKNTQMQYMMYATGMKAMDEVSENLYTRMRNGEDFNSFSNVYQEWLNTNDKHFVTLFETEEYSKLMSEVSALQLGLKKKIENQMEKAFSNLPLINRSEMDELYLTIQGLKSRISMLENQIDTETSHETIAEVKETKTRKGSKANA
jgi:BMFP domain-containing protein YqiC